MPSRVADLPDGARGVVADVRAMFADLFDNDEYGPFAAEVSPQMVSEDRLAGFLGLAVGQVASYMPFGGLLSRTDAANYPYSRPTMRYALEVSLALCFVEHLMRTYVEMPDTSRVGAPDVVRRDYLTRWQGIANDLKDKLKQAAQKAAAEEFDEEYAAGRYVRTLIDFPSVANTYVPFNTAERPQITWWF